MLKGRHVCIIVTFDETVRVIVTVNMNQTPSVSYLRPSSNIQIKSPMGHRDEMIVPGDLEDYSNMLSHSWSAERNTSIHICDK